MNFLQLPPDPMAQVYDSLNGGNIARLRAVSKAHKQYVNATNQKTRNNKLRRANPNLRKQQDYQQALDLAWEFVSRGPRYHVQIRYGNHFCIAYYHHQQIVIRPEGLTMQDVRSLNPDDVSIHVYQDSIHTGNLYPSLKPGTAIDAPHPRRYTYFGPDNLTRSGRIHSTHSIRPAQGREFYVHNITPQLNRSAYA